MLSVIIGTAEYSLDDGTLCRLVGYDGFGIPPATRISSRGPLQHGDTDEGFRLDPRLAKLIFALETTELDVMYERRQTICDLFSPIHDSILKFDLSYGVRYLDCHYYDDASLEWSVKNWAAPRFALTVKASDPTLYDPERKVEIFGIGASGAGFTLPMPLPFAVGITALDELHTIFYPGTWLSYPEIQIYGPITDLLIENTDTGDKLDFTGITIIEDDYYIIDTRYGYKTVVDQDGVNKIADLTEDSDLATFAIDYKRPDESFRENTFRATGSAINSETRIFFRYYERYIGV